MRVPRHELNSEGALLGLALGDRDSGAGRVQTRRSPSAGSGHQGVLAGIASDIQHVPHKAPALRQRPEPTATWTPRCTGTGCGWITASMELIRRSTRSRWAAAMRPASCFRTRECTGITRTSARTTDTTDGLASLRKGFALPHFDSVASRGHRPLPAGADKIVVHATHRTAPGSISSGSPRQSLSSGREHEAESGDPGRHRGGRDPSRRPRRSTLLPSGGGGRVSSSGV
jgi:hypothetical protein